MHKDRSADLGPDPDKGHAAPPGLRERKKQALRDRLVEIAGRRFGEAGYAGTGMRDIADEAGVAYQTLYNHYPNKARLGMAWLQSLTVALADQVSPTTDAVPEDPLAFLLAGADLYVELVAGTDRELWREVTAEYLRTPEAFDDATRVLHVGARERVATLLTAWQAAGALRADADPNTLAGVIYALVDHAMLRFIAVSELSPGDLITELHAQLELVMRPAMATGADVPAGSAVSRPHPLR